MKTLTGIFVTALGLTLIALALIGFGSAAEQFGKMLGEWQNPPPAKYLELSPTTDRRGHDLPEERDEIEVPGSGIRSRANPRTKNGPRIRRHPSGARHASGVE